MFKGEASLIHAKCWLDSSLSLVKGLFIVVVEIVKRPTPSCFCEVLPRSLGEV